MDRNPWTNRSRRRTSVRVFGGAGVWHDGAPVSVGGPRQRMLLALLAIRAGTVAEVDWVTDNLWPDEDRPEDGERALRTYVSRLRRSLPDDGDVAVETVPGGYRLNAPLDAVEHIRFSELRAAARRAREDQDPGTARRLLGEALELWRGDPFPELEDLAWARAEIERLRQERLETVEERFEVELTLGRHTQIVGELAAFTSENRLRERAWRQYALALHHAGRTAEALRTIQVYRAGLLEESGLDPSPGMLDLEHRLLDGEVDPGGPEEGRPLRGYRLLEQIGSGAFSVVWRAVQPSVQREVAIKQVRAELATQPEFIRRFEAEAQFVARIEHPHIVPLIDYWRDPDSAYLVMRWLRGGTLEDRLDDGPLSVDETLALVAQVGDALATAHAAEVIHRDVKPANILFDERGNAYLGDFGIALEPVDTSGPVAALSPGTPTYASPEQLRRDRLGPAADVFSLAVVVFECLAGSVPFPDTSDPDELIRRQVDEPFPALSSLRPDVPRSVSDAIARATAKDPDERFATAEELVEALRATSVAADPRRRSGAATVVDGVLANPYLGLRAFSEVDAQNFFGRDRLVSEVVDRFGGVDVSSRCVVLVGPSGSGKSSVARAGVVPAVRAGRVAGSEAWFTTTMVPGPDPYEALEAALLRVAVNPPAALLTQLRDGPRGVLRAINRCVTHGDDRVLLVLDQFEELFTTGDPATSDAFLTALAVAVEEPSTPLRLLGTLRADFYDHPLRHATFARILKVAAVDVTPLAPDELDEAITAPAAQVGVTVEGALVTRLAAEAMGQPAPLPLMQHTLAELFDRRLGALVTAEAYDELGGMSGALAARAESLYTACTRSEQRTVRSVFGRLVDPHPGRGDIRRRVAVRDLGDDLTTRTVIDRFAAGRLLTRDRDPFSREPTVEVAHEALLREWPRLTEWLTEDRAMLAQIDALQAGADRWTEGGRQDADLLRGRRLDAAGELAATATDRIRPVDRELVERSTEASEARARTDARRQRRLRRLVTATAIALVMALVAAGVAVGQRNRADGEADRALAAAANAEEARDRAERVTLLSRARALTDEDPSAALLLAVEAYRNLPSNEAKGVLLDALRSQDGVVSRSPLPPLAPATCATAGDGRARPPTDDGWSVHSIETAVLVVDPLTGDIGEWVPPSDPCARPVMSWHDGPMLFETLDAVLAQSEPGGAPVTVFELETLADEDVARSQVSLAASGPDEPVVGIVDQATGELHLFEVGGDAVASPVDADLEFGEVSIARSGEMALGLEQVDNTLSAARVQLLEARTGEPRWTAELDGQPVDTAWSPSEAMVAIAIAPGEAVVLSTADGSLVAAVGTAQGRANSLTFVDDTTLAIMTGSDVELHRLAPVVRAQADSSAATERRIRVPDGFHVRSTGRGLAVRSVAGRDVTVVDPDDEVLTERHPVPLDARAAVAPSGVAGVVDVHEQTAWMIDLTTGATSPVDPSVPGTSGTAGLIPLGGPEDRLVFSVDGTISAVASGEVRAQFDPRAVDLPGGPWIISHADGHGERIALVLKSTAGERHAVVLLDLRTLEGLIEVGGAGLPSGVYPSPDLRSLVVDLGDHLEIHGESGTITTIDGVVPAEHTSFAAWGTDLLYRATELGTIEAVDVYHGSVEIIDRFESGVNAMLRFARDEMVAHTESGDIWLLDTLRRERVGRLGSGGAAEAQGPTEGEDGVRGWVVSSNEIVGFGLDPDEWVDAACRLAGRNLTAAEWEELVPGEGPYRATCREWPEVG